MKKKLQLIFYIFSIAAFAFVLYYFSAIRTDIKLIGKVNVSWLSVSILAQLATYLFSAFVYYRLLKIFQPSMQITISQLYQASIVALFANQIVPFAGISGNIFFYSFLKNKKILAQNIFTVVIVELLTFYIAIEIIILAAFAACLCLHKTSPLFLIILIGGVLIYILFAFAIAIMGRKETVNALCIQLMKIKLLKKYADRLKKFVNENSSNMRKSLPFVARHKKNLAPVIAWHACIFLCDSFTVYALFYGLGVSIAYPVVFIAFILTKVISLLPISPGALIVYESSLTFFLTELGAPLGTAVIVTLLFRTLSFWLPMPIGLLLTGKLSHQRFMIE